MTNQETTQINRLIETGEPENLSLAYHLMIATGLNKSEAIWHMMHNFHNPLRFERITFTLDFVHFEMFSIWPNKNNLICGSPLTQWSCEEDNRWSDLRRILTQTRHIWQDKI